MTKTILITSVLCSFLLIGCTNSVNNGGDEASSTISGQLVDSYISNVEYLCSDDTNGTTDINGSFECATLPIKFKLGGLELGTITQIPSDNQIFPQDLLGVQRADLNNTEVIAMARFLQSCDEDNNTENGIQIRQRVRTAFIDTNLTFDATQIDTYAEDANISLIDTQSAISHLTLTTEYTDAVNGVTKLPTNVRAALLTPRSILNQDVINTLSYMGNEERLAYDVYTKLYEYFPSLFQFTKIAENSETTHMTTVQLLAKKYALTHEAFTNIDSLPSSDEIDNSNIVKGEYEISELQELYDALILKGRNSQQDALEVGCMVEVTDINDLETDIALAKEANASDVVVAFNFLRDGSYSHYWSFDRGLKNLGVTDGCCTLGVIDGVDYCQPDYPQNMQGGGHAKR